MWISITYVARVRPLPPGFQATVGGQRSGVRKSDPWSSKLVGGEPPAVGDPVQVLHAEAWWRATRW